MEEAKRPSPVQALKEHRAALTQLARSGEAQQLMELLNRQGGVKQAAQAAAAGDPAALMDMMNRLMSTGEGAGLVEKLSSQARQAGLE